MPISNVFGRSLSLLVLPLLTLGLLAGCGNGNSTNSTTADVPYQVGEALSDSTAAVVVSSDYGTDTLSAQNYQRQIKMTMQRRSPSQQSGMQETHRQLIRGFARQHALRGEAKAQNIDADTAQVSARIAKLKQRYKSEKQFRQQLAQNNMTVDSVRSLLADRLRQQTLQQQMAENFEEPSADEVEAYSEENRRIRAQHILLKVGEDAPQAKIDSAREAAAALVDSAQMESVDFAELARRNSQGPTAKKGGDLGFFTRDRMVEEFADAAYALSDSGDVAPEPVRTQFGFHVIRLTNAGKPMDTGKARKQMTQERRKQTVEDQIDALLEDVTVHANPDIAEAGFYE